jgi:transcriptional regulator with AAA-type ATPase domain
MPRTALSPAAVGDFIRRVAESGRLAVAVRARRRLSLGRTEDGRECSLAVRGRNMLITGETNSGKSWLAGLLCCHHSWRSSPSIEPI